MHSLIKFFSNMEYLKDFMAGHLYMNTLDYFWNNGFDEQKDIFEGVICTVQVKDFGAMPFVWQSIQATDYRFRAEGYRYCNVLCFYKQKYDLTHAPLVNFEYDSKMFGFGEYVVFITNEREFIRRIGKASDSEGFRYLCGDVRYHKLMINGKPTKEGNLTYFKATNRYFTVDELQRRGFKIIRRDCFNKSIQYQSQNEWRIALYRGMKETEAYVLNVGDLSDIVTWFHTSIFEEEIKKNANMYAMSERERFYGNISRKEMQEAFYNIGEQKTSMFMTL